VAATDSAGRAVKVCAFKGRCAGTVAVFDCTPWGQPYFLDCANQLFGAGASCGAAPMGIGCVNVAAGAYCDNEYFICRTGLTCDTTTNRCK
jgi:hypothetical protein